MTYREHKKQSMNNFIFNETLTYFSSKDIFPSELHVMAIISMANTPQGHHCLAHTATLTVMYCVSFDPSNMSPDPDTDKGSIEIQQIHS
jgi:hypothetical protein